MNLESAITTFLLSQPNLGTRKAYRSCLIPLQDYIGLARPVDEVNVMEVVRYSSKLYDKDYSPATIRKHVISIKAFFNWLIKIDVLEKSPAAAIKTPARKSNTRLKAVKNEEFEILRDYTWKTSPRNHALVLFAGDTGCREIAMRRLRISDLNLEDHSAQITGKGDKTRTVYYGDECKAALEYWLKVKPINTTDYVFRERVNSKTSRGELKAGVLSQVIRRITKKHGIGIDRSLGLHGFRHRLGHNMADSGTAPSIAQKVLGHANVETTLNHYYPDDDHRVREKMMELSAGYVAPTDDAPEKPKEPQTKIIVLPQKSS